MDVQPHLLNLSAFINQNLEKDLPLSSLAKRVGLSPFHFHRKFGAYFGESLHQHIKRLRLERAAYSLRHGDTPVRQIARDSGYKTVSAFSHAFSGFAGESPTRYRSLALSVPAAVEEPAASTMKPTWIGELESQAVAFVRATGTGSDVGAAIRPAIEHISSMIGNDRRDGSVGVAPDEVLAATSDVFRASNGDDFRMDICVDLDRVPVDRRGLFGTQVFPGGRYARFDVRCEPQEAMQQFAAALRGLREPPRLAQYFVRFPIGEKDDDGQRDYRLFVPLGG